MLQNTKRTIAILTATASLGGAGWALAGGASSSAGTASTPAQATATETAIATSITPTPPNGAQGRPPLQAEVTGDTAEKIKAAVLAKVPGATIDRVEKDPQGFHAHLTKSDGTRATARVNTQFEVTSVDAGGGPRMGGPGGQRTDETPLTGDNAAKAKAAALAKLPGSTVVRVETDADGGTYEAHVTKSDGSPATVIFDKDFKVTDVQER
jgi:hypothetical protein